MALQVWLPLNGDIKNLGCLPVTISANDLTDNANGKIGSCYSFNGSSSKIDCTLSTSTTSAIGSLACWVKLNTLPASNKYFELIQLGTAGGYAQSLLALYYDQGASLRGAVGGNSSAKWTNSTLLTTNTWYHLCMTYDGTNIKYYFNGELQYTTAQAVASFNTGTHLFIGGTNNYWLNGSLNDVRYYNHCLSTKEIKYLSQALVLHLPLINYFDKNSLQYDTNIYTEADGSQWMRIFHHNNPNANTARFSKTSDLWDKGYKLSDDAWCDIDRLCKQFTKFEFMCKQKTTNSAAETVYRWQQSISPLYATYEQIKPNQVTRITTTGYTDGGMGGLWKMDGSSTRFCIANTNSSNWFGAAGAFIVYSNGIPGYPNTTITTGYLDLYIKISDYPDNKVYDTSGYCHDGIIIDGPLTTNNIAPRYNSCTNFNGTVYIKESNQNYNVMTVSLWVCFTTISSGQNIIFVNSKQKQGLGLLSSGNSDRLCCSSGIAVGCVNVSDITANTWHHFVIVSPNGIDTATRTVYIDGVLRQPGASTNHWNPPTGGYLEIGKRSSSNDGFKGKISDFRMYATALSAADIKELYETSMEVDASGNITPRILTA